MSNRKHPVWLLLCLVVAVAFSATALSASAQADIWNGSNPAYSWTTGNGAYYSLYWEYAGVTSGPATICVSPVRYEGGKFVFPWGWQCGSGSIEFTHPKIEAAHGVYNPNGSRQYFNAGFLQN
jgi:hypothetical protein